jgi:hypothetical protein
VSNATRARLVAGALLVLVAGAGFAGGILTERLLLAQQPAPRVAATGPAASEGVRILLRGESPSAEGEGRRIRVMLPGQMAAELGLTPEQQAEIERILAEDQTAIRRLTDNLEPALVSVVQRSRQRIYDVLTDDQIARWHAMPQLRVQRGERQPGAP